MKRRNQTARDYVRMWLSRPVRVVATLILLCAFAVVQWIYWTHPDMPPARLFLTFWYVFVPALLAMLAAYYALVRSFES